MFFTYILYSTKWNRYYIGSCKNIEKRLKQHTSGAVQSTKAFRLWRVIYSESFPSNAAARKRELQIKSYKHGEAFKKLIERASRHMRPRSSAGRALPW